MWLGKDYFNVYINMMRMVDACFAGKLLIEGSMFNKDGCLNCAYCFKRNKRSNNESESQWITNKKFVCVDNYLSESGRVFRR
jgi:hypothetical protein